MGIKQRFYIGTILFLALVVLSYWYKNNLSMDYLYFSIILIGLLALYLMAYCTFKMLMVTSKWTRKIDHIIAFFVSIGILIFGMNMANRIDDEQPSFWLNNGNIWLTDVFGALIALIIGYIFFSWVFKKWKSIQTLKNEKSIAELSLLKNQINPHFFFNTLNNLYSLIKSDPDTAQDYVLKLSDMMRFTIYKGKEEMVTLKEEVNYLSNFIELQTARYHKKIEINFKQSIENPETRIPPLLFIILLENTFKHGVESLIDNAFIYIDLIENKNGISFSIKNNFDLNEVSKTTGIGLVNLKERLNLLYPNTHSFNYNSDGNTYFSKLELHKK